MDYVRLHSQLHPQDQAVADLASGRSWSYAAFDDYIARCSGLLMARGLRSGDRLACLSKNRADVIVLHLACARIGIIFVPLNSHHAQIPTSEPVTGSGEVFPTKYIAWPLS